MAAGLVVEVVVVKESIASIAWAGAASASQREQAAQSERSARAGRGDVSRTSAICVLIVDLTALDLRRRWLSHVRWLLWWLLWCLAMALLHALAVLLDEALLALGSAGGCVAVRGAAIAVMSGGGGRRAAGAVALVGGLAGGRSGTIGEAAAFAGVIDLHLAAVFVLGDEGVAGEEVGVGAVGADAEQARVEGAGAGGDQVEAVAGGLAEGGAVGAAVAGALGLPLIDVLLVR